MRSLHTGAVLALVLAVAACSGKTETSANASASPSAAASAETSASPESVAANATPTPAAESTPAAGASVATASVGAQPTIPPPSPNPNLLANANGTILRSYSPAQLDDSNDGDLGNFAENPTDEPSDAAKLPYTLTFELPGVATISEFSASPGEVKEGQPPANVVFSVSTTGPDSGFTDVATITRPESGPASPVPLNNVKARWIRVVVNGHMYGHIGATGTIAPLPHPVDPSGLYIEEARPYKAGSLQMAGTKPSDDHARFVMVGNDLVSTQCNDASVYGSHIGQLDGRTWRATFAGNKDVNPRVIHAVVNDEGTLIAGANEGGSAGDVFMRTTATPPKFCAPRQNGVGAHHVLVLDQDPIPPMYPVDASTPLGQYAISAIGAGMLTEDALKGEEMVVVRGICKARDLLSPQQIALLLRWTAAGHKLLLTRGECASGADYSWLPTPLTSAGAGPGSTNASLVQVENDALGTNDKNDAEHFFDPIPYVSHQNGLDAANVITTQDPHWCGHFFVAKTTNLNGFVQAYATDGSGLLMYDGFYEEDRPPLQRIRQLEFALPAGAELPCTRAGDERVHPRAQPRSDVLGRQGADGARADARARESGLERPRNGHRRGRHPREREAGRVRHRRRDAGHRRQRRCSRLAKSRRVRGHGERRQRQREARAGDGDADRNGDDHEKDVRDAEAHPHLRDPFRRRQRAHPAALGAGDRRHRDDDEAKPRAALPGRRPHRLGRRRGLQPRTLAAARAERRRRSRHALQDRARPAPREGIRPDEARRAQYDRDRKGAEPARRAAAPVTANGSLEIVDARPDDLDQLSALFDAYLVFYERSSDREGARAFLAERVAHGRTRFFLARIDGRVAGFAHLLPSYDTLGMTNAWILEDLFVDAASRRRGVAGALLEHAAAFARETGATRISLTTAHTNVAAQRLYEAHGYLLDTVFRAYHCDVRERAGSGRATAPPS